MAEHQEPGSKPEEKEEAQVEAPASELPSDLRPKVDAVAAEFESRLQAQDQVGANNVLWNVVGSDFLTAAMNYLLAKRVRKAAAGKGMRVGI